MYSYRFLSRTRFEDFLSSLVFSPAEDPDQQVLDFLKAVNDNLKIAFTPGDHVCVDESMIKSFHKKLNGKVKIMRKPRPIGSEIKDISDSRTNIVFCMELHEKKEVMQRKDYVGKFVSLDINIALYTAVTCILSAFIYFFGLFLI